MGTLNARNSIGNAYMERIKRGDESAMSDFVAHYRPGVRRFLIRHWVRCLLREDIMQDVWIKVWMNADSFITGECVDRWLIRIARNAMYDAMRKIKRRNRDVALSQLLHYTNNGIEDGYDCLEAVVSESGNTVSVEDIIEAASEVLEPLYLDEVVAMYRGGSAEERSRETGECASTLRWRRSEALAQLRSSGKFTKQFANAFGD